jgi:class 3 adenylate cyclase
MPSQTTLAPSSTAPLAESLSGLPSVLLADVRGGPRFTQDQGDEAAAQLVARFALVVREGVLSHGHVDETRGELHARCSR